MLKQSEPTVNISASIPLSVFEEVGLIVSATKISRSKVIKELISLGLNKYKKDLENQTSGKRKS